MATPFSNDEKAADPSEALVTRIGPQRSQAEALIEQIVNELAAAGYNQAATFAIRLAFEEAVSNAIKHGNQNDPDLLVEIAYHITPERFYLRLTDQGDGFDHAAVSDPTLDENLTNPAGRGLLLMRAYMSKVEFSERGNTVHMTHTRRT